MIKRGLGSKWGSPEIRGSFLKVSHNKDYNVWAYTREPLFLEAPKYLHTV